MRHRRALSVVRPFAVVFATFLLLTLLAGCIVYDPNEDSAEETTVTEPAAEDTTEDESDTTAVDTGFPNEPEAGHTKRY